MIISPGPASPERTTGIDPRRGKLRVAIGLFGHHLDAGASAQDLEQGGVAQARIAFAARSELIESPALAARRAGGYGWLSYSPCDDSAWGSFVLVSQAGEAASAEFCLVGDALNDHLHQRSLRQQERQLHTHLQGDGWLLIVRLTEAAEQHAVCSTLLRRARFGVQSHEMRRT